ncbi:bacteriocin family protein [Eubacteriales bacterium OttesenSCG-928-N14]|nr:bacteriocin family protein [Eubacteriales bacterium OttesenSCG-928-N14]
MDYLTRDDAPFDEQQWEAIDNTVVSAAKRVLTARRVLPFNGNATIETQFARIDGWDRAEEFDDAGIVKSTNRKVVEIPQLYADFWLYWRDLADAKNNGVPMDLSAAEMAAQRVARLEDEMVFYGVPGMNIEGLLTVKGSQSIKKGNWGEGEASFTDVAKGIEALEGKGHIGRHSLFVSPDVYVQLQRIQDGTGVLESERIEKLLSGKLVKSTALKANTALLVCAEAYCMDLLVGQDIRTAYIEAVDLNHHLRVLETAVVRIKAPDAIVVYK